MAKSFPREGFNIRPDRCRSQNARFHARQKVVDDKGFDFHVSNNIERSNNSLSSSFETACSCANGNGCWRLEGMIHIINLFKRA